MNGDARIQGARPVRTADETAGVLSLVLAGHEPVEVDKALSAEGIVMWTANHAFGALDR